MTDVKAPLANKDYAWPMYNRPSKEEIERFNAQNPDREPMPEIKGVIMGRMTPLMKEFLKIWAEGLFEPEFGQLPILQASPYFSPEDLTRIEKGFGRISMSSIEGHEFVKSKRGPEHDVTYIFHGRVYTRSQKSEYDAEYPRLVQSFIKEHDLGKFPIVEDQQ